MQAYSNQAHVKAYLDEAHKIDIESVSNIVVIPTYQNTCCKCIVDSLQLCHSKKILSYKIDLKQLLLHTRCCHTMVEIPYNICIKYRNTENQICKYCETRSIWYCGLPATIQIEDLNIQFANIRLSKNLFHQYRLLFYSILKY